jgi:diguanylate cyclase (GGDEF)-like protein
MSEVTIMWQQHQQKICLALLVLLAQLGLAFQLGEAKFLSDIDWFDFLGESVALLVVMGWLGLIISSRPPGPVTQWLFYGSLLLVSSNFLNMLDEWIHYPADVRIMSWLESMPAPLGMLALTIGLIGWHKEQRALDRLLKGRELFLRDHQLLDPLTQLYGCNYLLAILQRELKQRQLQRDSKTAEFCVIAVDLQNFAEYNRLQGIAAGDKLLCQLAELLCQQLRYSDVVCRYSADCFVMVLPESSPQQATILAQHLQHQWLTLQQAQLTMLSRVNDMHLSSASIQYSDHAQASAMIPPVTVELRIAVHPVFDVNASAQAVLHQAIQALKQPPPLAMPSWQKVF